MTEPVLRIVKGAKNSPPDRGVSGPLPPRPSKEAPLSERELREGMRLLLELVATKRRLYVKPRDLVRLGYGRGDPELSLLGKVLGCLARRGLAIRWNTSRPRRYSLVPAELWLRFVEAEARQGFGFDCERGDTLCSLVGLCPYWALRGAEVKRS